MVVVAPHKIRAFFPRTFFASTLSHGSLVPMGLRFSQAAQKATSLLKTVKKFVCAHSALFHSSHFESRSRLLPGGSNAAVGSGHDAPFTIHLEPHSSSRRTAAAGSTPPVTTNLEASSVFILSCSAQMLDSMESRKAKRVMSTSLSWLGFGVEVGEG